jgi:cell division septal protein FtsQ
VLALARETSVFGVERVSVRGADFAVARQVERRLRPFLGRSLLKTDAVEVEAAVEALPTIVSARVDRAFPHVLEVDVVPERPVAVVRQGAASWLVSGRGRVMARVDRTARPALPRVWAPRETLLEPGAIVQGPTVVPLEAAQRIARSGFPGRVRTLVVENGELTLVLRSGLRIRMGEAMDVPLKLAVAGRVLRLLPDGMAYLDVSVPDRPVAGTNTKPLVEVDTQLSTPP